MRGLAARVRGGNPGCARLDRRFAGYLLGHGRYLHVTHQAVADELGTVREIITRCALTSEPSIIPYASSRDAR
jgi:hypothetical protein